MASESAPMTIFPGDEGEHRQRLDPQGSQGGAVSGCLLGQVVEPVQDESLATDEDRPGGPGVGALRLLTLDPLEAAADPLARPAERALARAPTDRDAVGAGERSHETKSILQVALDVLRGGRDEPLRESCNEQFELVAQARPLAGPGTFTVLSALLRRTQTIAQDSGDRPRYVVGTPHPAAARPSRGVRRS